MTTRSEEAKKLRNKKKKEKQKQKKKEAGEQTETSKPVVNKENKEADGAEKKKKKKKKKKAGDTGVKKDEKSQRDEKDLKGKEEPKPKKTPENKEATNKPTENKEPVKLTEDEEKESKYTPVTVPNVTPKMDPKEQAKLQAMFGNLQKQHAHFFVDEVGKESRLEDDPESTGLDLKKVPSVYFKNCKNGSYVLNRRVTKVLIERCENVTVTLNGNILTNTMEIWNCKNFTLKLNNEVRTLQLDMLSDIKIEFSKLAYMGALIWNQMENLSVSFRDKKELDFKTGFAEMKKKYPDSVFETDQFIIRYIEGEILQERCVRLKNGYLSTEREAIDWDKRNIIKRDAYVQSFLKEAGIHLKKAPGSDEVSRNAKCACGSGKKFKRCCQGKKTVTGVVGKDVSFK